VSKSLVVVSTHVENIARSSKGMFGWKDRSDKNKHIDQWLVKVRCPSNVVGQDTNSGTVLGR